MGTLTRSEARLLARQPAAIGWAAAAPLTAMVVLGCVPAVADPQAKLGGISYLTAYTPILMVFAFTMACINVMPPTLAGYRESGVLRRMRTSPVRPSRLLAAQALNHALLALAVAVTIFVLGVTAFDAGTARQAVGVLITLLLLGSATTAVGVLIAAVARTAKAANAMGMGAFFVLIFFAGMWIPRSAMTPWLRYVSDWTPLGAGVRALQDALAGQFPAAQGLVAMALWTVGASLLAARLFRWE